MTMLRRSVLALSCALLPLSPALSAQVQPDPIWGGYFNMGVFAAGGGSEADGHLSLECSGESLDDAGAFFLQLTTASRIEAFVDAPPELDFTIDGTTLTLPVTAENGKEFFYRSDPEDDAATLALIGALRRGLELVVSAPEVNIAWISLRGSSRALVYVEQCVREND